MDISTDNVTISAAFIKDILNQYKDKPADYAHLVTMTQDISLSNARNMVPMKIYNDMCQWIENQIGQANTRILGRKIGNTAFQAMVANKLLKENPTSLEAMQALVTVAAAMISDPKKRGWEILESGPKHIVMRRTQTFNSTLQFGLLDEIVRKTGVFSPKIEYLKSIERGDEFDDYKITWI